MTNEELERENKELKERIEFLEKVLNRGNAGNSTAYTSIRLMIIEKVEKEFDATKFENWRRKYIENYKFEQIEVQNERKI